ncbi:MAG TPA: histidine phosphatase family protein [Candidatus Limnocylindria bacterium]|nr:histidine phosphatase family protein [Candidatus Limnocylindria bacterium]
MILYFLRHGRAEDARAGDDEGRRLSAEGAAQLRAASAIWRRLNLRPDVVVSSPLPRARETARIFCEALGVAQPRTDDDLRPGAGWPHFARALARHPDARRVAFVGHEPDLSAAISEVTGASSVRMRPGGLACVEFYGVPEPAGGEIAWLIDPDLYAGEPTG